MSKTPRRQPKNHFKPAAGVALITTIVFAVVIEQTLTPLECTVTYLNPWQHAAQCALFYGYHYALVFAFSFLIALAFLRYTSANN